jgi:hypothetical protein
MTSNPSASSIAFDASPQTARRGPGWKLIVLASACALPAVLIFFLRMELTKLDRQLRQSQLDLQEVTVELELRELKERDLEQQLESVNSGLKDLYKHWRTVEEIPEFLTELVVFYTQGHGVNSQTFMTVPRGRHQLNMELKFTPEPVPGGIVLASSEVVVRSYDLVGPASYCFSLQHSATQTQTAQPLTLELTSNSADFETIRENAIDQIESPGAISWGGNNTNVLFPNQLDFQFGSNSMLPSGITVRQETWNTQRDDQRVQVNFSLRLVSEGPPVVPAHKFYPVNYDENYLGKGKYEYLPKSKPN